MCLLARYAQKTGCSTYSSLVDRMLGRGASLAMCLVMFLYPFGSCIAYLVIIGDSFQPLLLAAFGSAWWTGRSAVIAGVSLTCVLPLCFPTRLGALKAVSSACVSGLMVVVGAVVYRSVQIVLAPDYSWASVRAFNPSPSFLSALPLIIFAFHCHTNLVSIWDELEDRPRLFFPAAGSPRKPHSDAQVAGQPGVRGSRKLAGMTHVVAAGVSITGLFYTLVALAGYLAFPVTARSNIILNFSQHDWLMQAARACIGLIQICAYPVNHHPARGAVLDFVRHTTGANLGGAVFHVIEPLLFYGATLTVALACSDLGVILSLVGGTCGSMLIFLMPGALLVQDALDQQRTEQQHPLPLQEPLLLEGGAAAEDGESGCTQQQGRSLWCSMQLWAGVGLMTISACVAALAVGSALHSLPPT
ncbi:hypothetical protein D9Q98_005944 [Chlorella vulgaris]|uniref:Amino acid transporter transmembrane domain-containing protein n=1 Tax=Chlorella vulgaris TaxID=3077 RepID=A0A9D4TWR5_CHLVU|nr:hypothetical protein D9Q98_005944 [Chlorella vulgaris]